VVLTNPSSFCLLLISQIHHCFFCTLFHKYIQKSQSNTSRLEKPIFSDLNSRVHALPRTAKVFGVIIHAPPPLSSRSSVYSHKITNQIPSFSRLDAACSNTAKIDSIQRWMHRSNFRPSDHASHHQIHALPVYRIILPTTSALLVSLTRGSTHGSLDPIHDLVSFIFIFYFQ
jgi:hypothetical protein